MSLTYEKCLKEFPKLKRELLLCDSNIINVTCGPVGIGDKCYSEGEFKDAIMLLAIKTLRPTTVDVQYMGDTFPVLLVGVFPTGRLTRVYGTMNEIITLWIKSLIVNEPK